MWLVCIHSGAGVHRHGYGLTATARRVLPEAVHKSFAPLAPRVAGRQVDTPAGGPLPMEGLACRATHTLHSPPHLLPAGRQSAVWAPSSEDTAEQAQRRPRSAPHVLSTQGMGVCSRTHTRTICASAGKTTRPPQPRAEFCPPPPGLPCPPVHRCQSAPLVDPRDTAGMWTGSGHGQLTAITVTISKLSH